MEEAHSNPIITQLRALKRKLQQKDQVIAVLTECIKTQEAALLSIVNEFEQHENLIMRRLHRLEDINIRYIKNYLEIKQQERMEEFVPLQHMFLTDSREYIKEKVEAVRSIYSQGMGSGVAAESKKVVDNCLGLMKDYLCKRKIQYEKQIGHLMDERKRKLKESKGLQAYRQSKEQAKFIDLIKGKVNNFHKKISAMDQQNIVEVFHSRVDIEGEIMRLDPQRGEITLEDSKIEQQMFKGIVEEIIECNAGPESYFLEGSFNFIEQRLGQLSEIYGISFVNESIESMQGLTAQSKQNILNNRIENKGHFMNKKHGYNQQNTSILLESQQQIEQERQKQIKKNAREGGGQRTKGQGQDGYDSYDEEMQQGTPLGMFIKDKKKLPKTGGKLNQKFETTISKTFFQQQQKSRDQLINKQETEIAQHEKVIDKLITFIKKQFKDRKMDDIDADDPQQLIGYYFKVNEKKYVDIRQQMQELQKETAKTVNTLTFENEQLNIRINDLKEQMDQLREKYQKSTFQLHILVSRTEDLVKISLETLISTCMNSITPEKLIAQLERIIDLIKENMDKKRDITYKFTIKEQYIEDKEPREHRRDYYTEIKEKKDVFGSFLSEVVNLQIEKIRQSSEISNNSHLSVQSNQKQPDFIPQKVDPQIPEKSQISQKINELPMEDNIMAPLPIGAAKQESQGFDENFLKNITQQIEKIKDRNFNTPRDEFQDMKEMYQKYKQALSCLERAEHLNRQNQIKYQKFLAGLKKKGAWECPEKLEEKLFYMQKLINEQNQLLHNQRAEYEQTILKQVNESESLAQRILKQFNLRPRRPNV